MRHRVRANPSGSGVNIRIQVQGGTLGDKFLCESCEYGAVMRGPSMKQIQIQCSGMEGPAFPVPFRVVKCNRYRETDSTDVRRMKEDAYYILKTAHGGVHVLTRAQFDDYNFVENLEEADARKVLKSSAHPKVRRRTLVNPKPRRR